MEAISYHIQYFVLINRPYMHSATKHKTFTELPFSFVPTSLHADRDGKGLFG